MVCPCRSWVFDLFAFFGVGAFFRAAGGPLFFEFFEFGEAGVGAF